MKDKMPNKVNSYRDLLVWKKALELTIAIYRATRSFPNEEKFGLSSQMQRAGVSVPSNIAEGQGRNSQKDFIRFLNIARGSLAELDTQTIIAKELGYLQNEQVNELSERIDELQRMLYSLINKLGGTQ
jgi:four helix bundle protein